MAKQPPPATRPGKNKSAGDAPAAGRGFRGVVLIAILAVVALAAIYVIMRRVPEPVNSASAVSPMTGTGSGSTPSAAMPMDRAAPAATAAAIVKVAAKGELPPLPAPDYPPPRPAEIVAAVYEFAARHPEILQYVPCYCGCQQAGHHGNDDCFVASRDGEGHVTWEPHGMDCSICIDIAHEAMQMYSSGAGAADIRAAIERKYDSRFPSKTPTPPVPPTP